MFDCEKIVHSTVRLWPCGDWYLLIVFDEYLVCTGVPGALVTCSVRHLGNVESLHVSRPNRSTGFRAKG